MASGDWISSFSPLSSVPCEFLQIFVSWSPQLLWKTLTELLQFFAEDNPNNRNSNHDNRNFIMRSIFVKNILTLWKWLGIPSQERKFMY